MPVIYSDGCPIHVEVEGPERAPVLMLSNSLGTDLSMWTPQMPAFTRHYRVVRYDRRGHGKSGVTPGSYSMEMLCRDAIAVMDGLGLRKISWCGLSMGGMEAMWLGANAADRIEKIIIANSSCYYPVKEFWNERIKLVRENGIAAIADRLLGLWFSQDFHEREPHTIARYRELMISTPLEGYLGCSEAVRDMDHRELLPLIKAPTLVIAGRFDNATPIENSEFIRSRIPGAALTIIDGGHLSNVEQPDAFAVEVLGHLDAR